MTTDSGHRWSVVCLPTDQATLIFPIKTASVLSLYMCGGVRSEGWPM